MFTLQCSVARYLLFHGHVKNLLFFLYLTRYLRDFFVVFGGNFPSATTLGWSKLTHTIDIIPELTALLCCLFAVWKMILETQNSSFRALILIFELQKFHITNYMALACPLLELCSRVGKNTAKFLVIIEIVDRKKNISVRTLFATAVM